MYDRHLYEEAEQNIRTKGRNKNNEKENTQHKMKTSIQTHSRNVGKQSHREVSKNHVQMNPKAPKRTCAPEAMQQALVSAAKPRSTGQKTLIARVHAIVAME